MNTNSVLLSIGIRQDCMSAFGLPDKHQGDGQDIDHSFAGLAQSMSGQLYLVSVQKTLRIQISSDCICEIRLKQDTGALQSKMSLPAIARPSNQSKNFSS